MLSSRYSNPIDVMKATHMGRGSAGHSSIDALEAWCKLNSVSVVGSMSYVGINSNVTIELEELECRYRVLAFI